MTVAIMDNTYHNGILDAIRPYAEEEAKQNIDNPAVRLNDRYFMNLRKENIRAVLLAYRRGKKLNPEERRSRRFLRHENRVLRAKLNPTAVNVFLRIRPLNIVLNFMLGRHRNNRLHEQVFKAYYDFAAKQADRAQLQGQLKKVGFSASLETALQKRIDHNLKEFSIRHSEPQFPGVEFVLNFKSLPGKDKETHYLESMDVMKSPEVVDELRNREGLQITRFDTIGDLAYTAAEATTLVNGNPVFKSHSGQDHWMTLDRTLHPLPGDSIDLMAALHKLGMTDMDNLPKLRTTLKNLQAGQVHAVNVKTEGSRPTELKIGVSPDARNLFALDPDGKRIPLDPISDNAERIANLVRNNQQQTQQQKLVKV